jgi:murein DD-endopeptidase MepM/ murein hydrolase activator NlpD
MNSGLTSEDDLTKALQNIVLEACPLMGENYNSGDYLPIALHPGSELLKGWTPGNQADLQGRIEGHLVRHNKQIAYGGYMEERRLYQASAHFGSEANQRTLHLGLDLWAPAGHPVYAPVGGSIHSFAYNDQALDYGATIILKHPMGEGYFYTLYGHLSLRDLEGLYEGKEIERGQEFCHLGDYPENGGWPPHLHFQIIRDMEGYYGDYPGVVQIGEKEIWRERCPDPMMVVRM